MSDNSGRVITVEVLASLVNTAYIGSFTPVNIMKGFKKTGVCLINPGEVTDRQIAPSKALSIQQPNLHSTSSDTDKLGSPLFTPDKEALYQIFEEKYDIMDPGYVAWLKIHHPELNTSGCGSDTSSDQHSQVSNNTSKASTKSSEAVLNELLVFPEHKKVASKRGRRGVNTTAILHY